jgi:hypothetical protein
LARAADDGENIPSPESTGSFERGDLSVDAETREVRYCLSIQELVLFGTGGVALMRIFAIALGAPKTILTILWFLPFMWLWLIGGNLAVGLFRFKNFVARAIRTVPHDVPNSP